MKLEGFWVARLSVFLVLATPFLIAQSNGFPGFFDVAEELGVTLTNRSGEITTDYLLQSTGNGVGLFDYDNDGDLDLVIANGSTLENYKEGGDPVAQRQHRGTGPHRGRPLCDDPRGFGPDRRPLERDCRIRACHRGLVTKWMAWPSDRGSVSWRSRYWPARTNGSLLVSP